MYNNENINTDDIDKVVETSSEELVKAGLPAPEKIYVGQPVRSWGAAVSEGSRVPREARRARKPYYALRGSVHRTSDDKILFWNAPEKRRQEVLYPVWENLLSDEQRHQLKVVATRRGAESTFQEEIVPILQTVKAAPNGSSWIEITSDCPSTVVKAWQKSEEAGKLPRLEVTKVARVVLPKNWVEARIAIWEEAA
jgi:hypothetical protein